MKAYDVSFKKAAKAKGSRDQGHQYRSATVIAVSVHFANIAANRYAAMHKHMSGFEVEAIRLQNDLVIEND
jgi:hypothetical protein